MCGTIPVMPMTALIVDDHPSFRRFARKLLEAAGLSSRRGRRRRSALAAVRALTPDVVCSTCCCPTRRASRSRVRLRPRPERPLVVLTSSRSAADLGGLAGWDGAAGFIPKSDLTVAALAALVGRRVRAVRVAVWLAGRRCARGCSLPRAESATVPRATATSRPTRRPSTTRSRCSRSRSGSSLGSPSGEPDRAAADGASFAAVLTELDPLFHCSPLALTFALWPRRSSSRCSCTCSSGTRPVGSARVSSAASSPGRTPSSWPSPCCSCSSTTPATTWSRDPGAVLVVRDGAAHERRLARL